ncbi:MAG: hypothetical protein RLZZ385_1389 [Pseudomonadota bacterium]
MVPNIPLTNGTEFSSALALHRQGNLQQASEAYARILAENPHYTPALNNLAVIARDMGRFDMALTLLKESLRIEPGNADVLGNAGVIALQLKKFAEAERYLREALVHKPGQPELRLQLAMALYGQERFADAASIFKALLRQQPRNFDLLYNLGVIANRRGDDEEALDYFHKALHVRSGDSPVLNQIAEIWLKRGYPERVQHFLDLSLASPVMNNRALALRAVALNLAGNEAELQALYSYPKLLQVNQVSVADEFGSVAEFNRRLIACLDARVAMDADPAGQATVNGLHSASITHIDDPAMVEMNRLIMSGFQRAVAIARDCKGHPWADWIPDDVLIDSWTIRLRAGGYQRAHIHPRAWLSGCYYVQVPEAVTDDAEARPGWIAFGTPDEVYRVSQPLALHAHRPRAGDLVTFPSYFWHHTVPFQSAEERISLAFDIVPR